MGNGIKTSYQLECEKRCKWCAQGLPRSHPTVLDHITGREFNGQDWDDVYSKCTAPTKDEFIEELVARLESE